MRILVRHYGLCEEVFGGTTKGAIGYGRKIKRKKSKLFEHDFMNDLTTCKNINYWVRN